MFTDNTHPFIFATYKHSCISLFPRAVDTMFILFTVLFHDDILRTQELNSVIAKFYTWLVEGEKPPRTKEELIQYGAGFELSPQEIAEALKENNVQFAGDEDTWAMMTNVLAEYAENKNGKWEMVK